MTDIVAPLFITTVKEALPQITGAVRQGADMIELRCDQASSAVIEEILQHPVARRKPVILTIRSRAEGGLFRGSEADRLTLILHVCRWKPDYVDIEYAAWRANPRFVREIVPLLAQAGEGASDKPKLILSTHNFLARPANLRARLLAMARIKSARIIKAAYQAKNLVDALEALRLYKELPARISQPLVIIAMGDCGLATRLLAGKYNAAFTFGIPAGGHSTAPGQPTIADLIGIYRLRQQRPDWPVFGIVGSPVAHSISPMIHNAGFQAVDFPGIYVPLPIEPKYEAFRQAVEAMRRWPGFNLRGLSVTIPHKANALRYVRSQGGTMDATSERIGAINTLNFSADGQVAGMNSDWYGALQALCSGNTSKMVRLAHKRVAVLGAGGVARAIVAALATLGATTVIYNRTVRKARELAAEFDGKIGHLSAANLRDFDIEKAGCHILINCTSMGMTPDVDRMPIADSTVIPHGLTVFDTVYNPRRTKLLDFARAGGATVIEGVDMLIWQAVVQFQGFTGKPAPIKVMRAAANRALRTKT